MWKSLTFGAFLVQSATPRFPILPRIIAVTLPSDISDTAKPALGSKHTNLPRRVIQQTLQLLILLVVVLNDLVRKAHPLLGTVAAASAGFGRHLKVPVELRCLRRVSHSAAITAHTQGDALGLGSSSSSSTTIRYRAFFRPASVMFMLLSAEGAALRFRDKRARRSGRVAI